MKQQIHQRNTARSAAGLEHRMRQAAGRAWKRPAAVILGVAVVCGFGAGCLHLEQNVVLRPDGTVLVSTHYSVPDEYYSMLEDARAQVDARQGLSARQVPYWPWNRQAVEEFIQNGGAQLVEYRTVRENGRRHAFIKYSGEYGKLAQPDGGMLAAELLDDKENGTQTLHLRLTETSSDSRDSDSDQSTAHLQTLYAGVELRFSMTVPGAIVRTTGRQLDDNKAAWVFDVDRDPGFLHRSPDISVTFKKTSGSE